MDLAQRLWMGARCKNEIAKMAVILWPIWRLHATTSGKRTWVLWVFFFFAVTKKAVANELREWAISRHLFGPSCVIANGNKRNNKGFNDVEMRFTVTAFRTPLMPIFSCSSICHRLGKTTMLSANLNIIAPLNHWSFNIQHSTFNIEHWFGCEKNRIKNITHHRTKDTNHSNGSATWMGHSQWKHNRFCCSKQ